MTVNAHDFLGIDTISKGNNKPWDKIIKYFDELPPESGDENVQFDFKGIEIFQPCNSSSFLKLLSYPRFSMVMYNSEEVVKSISLMCVLNGCDPDRIVNIKEEAPKVPTKEELDIEKHSNDLLQYFEFNGSEAKLKAYRKFDQIGNYKTVKYLSTAIDKYIDLTGHKNIIIETGMMSIQPNVTESMANMIKHIKSRGASLRIVSDDKSTRDRIGMYLDLDGAKYSDNERLAILKARLTVGRVGLFFRYKSGRTVDDFGRSGKGEIQSIRIAIFLGITKTGRAVFRTYKQQTFYTRAHWYLEHDGEEMYAPAYEDVEASMSELGIYNDYIGSKYHFSSCVQYKAGGETTMYSVTESGNTIGVKMTIPEMAKAVFDDFGIKYEHESLEAYIDETRRLLDMQNNK